MRVIAHLSDLHFGRHDAHVEEALLASLIERAPNLIAISGDFTQRARTHEFIAARRFLDCIPEPKLIVPGNHDTPLYDVAERLFRPFAKFDRLLATAGLQPPAYCDDEVVALGLNTARRLTGKNGRVSYEQMSLVRQVFGQVPEPVLKVLVTHHPLAAGHGLAPVEIALRAAPALDVVREVGVDLLLSGHHHRASSGHLDAELALGGRTLVVHAGTAISNRLRGGEGNSYNLIRSDGQSLEIAVMECTSTAGFHEKARARFVRRGNHWRVAD
jgi:3',5'-cyclic AMP phosphodiesterase CpdA